MRTVLPHWSLQNFYPRPPRGGRRKCPVNVFGSFLFLSTPSARRATKLLLDGRRKCIISIHALREEGDPTVQVLPLFVQDISIHALREEGDSKCDGQMRM